MASLEQLVKLGKELGYEGEDLRQFVKEEQCSARDMRIRERELELESIEKQKELEFEKIKVLEKEKELESEKKSVLELEHAVKSGEYDSQTKMVEAETKRLEAEMELKKHISPSEDTTVCGIKVKGPALPNFDESKDDLDAYLRRFELFATAAKWPQENWAIALSSHLTGKALEVYSRLTHDEAHDYEKVKVALMERLECTEEGFRVKFRTAKPQKGEKSKAICFSIKKFVQSMGRTVKI